MIKVNDAGLPVWEYPPYEPGRSVALFIPCYIDQFYPGVGQATVELLTSLGVTCEFPEQQTCCGQPAFNSGYWPEARKVIGQFCRAFEGYDWIVTPSSSCAAMARVFFRMADPDNETAAALGQRVFEISEFLVHILGVTDTGARYPHRVTMHIGCHGQRELGVVDAPLTLLKSVREIEYVELPNIEECCGFGGTFSVKMAGTSLAMGKTKAENILKTGAHTAVTADVSCMMHYAGIMRRDPRMKHIQHMHLVELLVQR